MNISILCSDPRHPVNQPLLEWQAVMSREGHHIVIRHKKNELSGGDILFLVSCSELITDTDRKKFKAVLVIHASDLPEGRGWSPHIWSIVSGKNEIDVCLLEACDPVDTGPVWLRDRFSLAGYELLDEINQKLFAVELRLMTKLVAEFETIVPVRQRDDKNSYYRERTQLDSRLDPSKSLAQQFDLLRVVDSERYPAFFEYRGQRYILTIEKSDDE